MLVAPPSLPPRGDRAAGRARERWREGAGCRIFGGFRCCGGDRAAHRVAPSPTIQGHRRQPRAVFCGWAAAARPSGGSGPTLPCPPVGRRAESRRRRRFRAIAGSPGPFFVGGRLRPGPRRSGPTPSVNVTLRTDCCRAVNREKLGETARVRERA